MRYKAYFSLARWFVVYLACDFACAESPAFPAQQLRNLRLSGVVELDCSSDKVFSEIFRIYESKESQFYNEITRESQRPPGMFFAWDHVRGKSHRGERLVLKDPTFWDLLKGACEKRNRRLEDLVVGVAFLSENVRLSSSTQVLEEARASEDLKELLRLFAGTPLQLIEISNDSNSIDFINAKLRESFRLMYKVNNLSRVPEIQFSADGGEVKGDFDGRAATFLGYWRYVDLLHVYGGMFGVEFVAEGPVLRMRKRVGFR